MNAYAMTDEQIMAHGANLRIEERCEATVRKYVGAVMALFRFLPPEKTVTRELLLAWKAEISVRFSASGANVMISAVNRFCAFMSWSGLRIKQIKVQRRIFRDCDRELTRAEYMRLLNAARAKGNSRLYWLMQTLASTGIRVSELRFVSVESLRSGRAVVDCKGKQRVVMIRQKLLSYCVETGVKSRKKGHAPFVFPKSGVHYIPSYIVNPLAYLSRFHCLKLSIIRLCVNSTKNNVFRVKILSFIAVENQNNLR